MALATLMAGAALAASPADSTLPAYETPAFMAQQATGAGMLAVTRAGSRLVAVGERGIILLSDDQGASWRQAQAPVQVSLVAVQFVDPRSGWAVGHAGVVLHSADGGQTWHKQLDGVQAAQLALQAAQRQAAEPDADADAATRWVREARQLVQDGPDKPLLDLYFRDERHGFVIGAYNLIFKTDDGGRHWQAWQHRTANPEGLHLYAMKALGGSLYVVGEQGLMLRSHDDGEHFQRLASPYQGTFFGVLETPAHALLAFGLRGAAYRSDDGGLSWLKVSSDTSNTLAAGTVLPDDSLVLVSQTGEVLRSRDDGVSFAPVPNPAPRPLTGVTTTGDSLVLSGFGGPTILQIENGR